MDLLYLVGSKTIRSFFQPFQLHFFFIKVERLNAHFIWLWAISHGGNSLDSFFFRFPFTFFILEFLGIHFHASSIHGRRKKCMEREKARNICGVMSEKPFSLNSFTAFEIIAMNISAQFFCFSNEKSRRCASESELINFWLEMFSELKQIEHFVEGCG